MNDTVNFGTRLCLMQIIYFTLCRVTNYWMMFLKTVPFICVFGFLFSSFRDSLFQLVTVMLCYSFSRKLLCNMDLKCFLMYRNSVNWQLARHYLAAEISTCLHIFTAAQGTKFLFNKLLIELCRKQSREKHWSLEIEFVVCSVSVTSTKSCLETIGHVYELLNADTHR